MASHDADAQALERALAPFVETLIVYAGDNPQRHGLERTPIRFLTAWRELTQGYRQDPASFLRVQFIEECDELISVSNIPFSSLCEHHLLPFHGKATLGYIPQDNRVVGLSKIPRLIHCFAQRLQTQERLTRQIAQTFQHYVRPIGVGVIIEARHSCMHIRGVRSDGQMTTSCLLGVFRDEPPVRQEFLALAHHR